MFRALCRALQRLWYGCECQQVAREPAMPAPILLVPKDGRPVVVTQGHQVARVGVDADLVLQNPHSVRRMREGNVIEQYVRITVPMPGDPPREAQVYIPRHLHGRWLDYEDSGFNGDPFVQRVQQVAREEFVEPT